MSDLDLDARSLLLRGDAFSAAVLAMRQAGPWTHGSYTGCAWRNCTDPATGQRYAPRPKPRTRRKRK